MKLLQIKTFKYHANLETDNNKMFTTEPVMKVNFRNSLWLTRFRHHLKTPLTLFFESFEEIAPSEESVLTPE
jgi:hypothetical protein